MAAALKYITVPPIAKHTATVIFVHGLGDTGHGWKPFADDAHADPSLRHVKWVLPHAPVRSVTANMGMSMPAWFDILSFDLAGDDEPSLLASVPSLKQLITAEIEGGIDPSRIILGGFSMGGALALLTGLTIETKLAGLIVLSGWLPLRDKFKTLTSPHAQSIPIFWGHGTADPMVKHELGRLSTDLLVSDVGVLPAPASGEYKGLTFNSYAGLGHSANEEELEDVKAWIKKAFPEE